MIPLRFTNRNKKRRQLASLLLLCLALDGHAVDSTPLPSFEHILARAHELKLAEDPYWLTLLHYNRGLFGNRGLIDDERFYLSPKGKHDPLAELEATLQGLWHQDASQSEDAVASRFPARTAFLAERLGFNRKDLPVSGSAELEKTLSEFAPRDAWIVFPTGFLASPASIFGHTFILVQGKNESPLLSQAISYGADTTGGGGPLSVILGLTGGYRGYFTVLPYHRKVQEYTDLDQRDIWENRLKFSAEEITRLLEHTWELRAIGSDYWFFDENCSFNLLYLLDAARPGLALHKRGGAWVMPSETIRWMQAEGLLDPARYRPSRATTVAYARDHVSKNVEENAVALAKGELAVSEVDKELSEKNTEQAHAFDLAGEILHALAGRQSISIKDYRTRLHAILGARAKLGKQDALPTPPPPKSPDQAHPPLRLGFGVGREDSNTYASLQIRAAQHDLLDREDGYVSGSALTFGEVELRWYKADEIRINRLDVVRVTSIAPYEKLFQRFSWTASGGLIDERMQRDGERHLQARLGGGAGLATNLPIGSAWVLGLVEGRAFGISEGYAIGPGAQIGVLAGLGSLRILGTATGFEYIAGWQETTWELEGAVRLAPSTKWALDVAASRYSRWDHIANGIQLRLFGYF